MKKLIIPKPENEILKTYPIFSKTEGWFIRPEEITPNAFVVEAINRYGRSVSKQGSEPEISQKEIEKLIKSIRE